MSPSSISAMSLVNDPAYQQFKDYLITTTGLAYYGNQDEELVRRLEGRLAALGLSQVGAYLEWLWHSTTAEQEWDALIAELTIGETFFFRHREQFDALRNRVLPDLIERRQRQRRLRIWSAGCATGAEPYSIAILLKRELGHLVAGWDVSIVGTDINREFLARAQQAQFADWAFRSGGEELTHSCCFRAGKLWALKPEFRHNVSFQYHNLVQHPFPSLLNNLSAFDLILCRNVMIYFAHDIVGRLIKQFHECLVEGGWLLVGHAESCVELFRPFHTLNVPGAVLYQKRKAASAVAESPPTLIGRSAEGISTNRASPAARTAPTSRAVQRGQKRRSPSPSPRKQPRTRPPTTAEKLADIRTKVDRAEWQEAARSCKELISLDRLNPTVHFYHALVMEQVGRHAETERALRRSIYLDRRFVLAHYHLGLLLQKRRDVAGAQRCFRNAIRLLDEMDEKSAFTDADGLTVGDLKQWTQTHLEVLCRS